MKNFLSDLRVAGRILLKNPGFAAVAVFVLALSIAGNTMVFSIADAVLLRPLPFAAPENLVAIRSQWFGPAAASGPVSFPDFLDLRRRNHVFEGMAVYRTDNFIVTAGEESASITGAVVSADLFHLLGARPAHGRTFRSEEDDPARAEGSLPAIISARLWKARFGADPAAVGRSLIVNDRPLTIVGIMEPEFQFPIQADTPDLWIPIALDYAGGSSAPVVKRSAHYLQAIARLKPGKDLPSAQADSRGIMAQVAAENPGTNRDKSVALLPFRESMVGDVRTEIVVLALAVGLMLLIACLNIASLFLARGAARENEIAVRTALGAGRWQVVRQLLAEPVLLAFAACVLGGIVARWGIALIEKIYPAAVPRSGHLQLDARTLLFTAALGVATALFCGIVPALRLSRAQLTSALREGGRNLSGGVGHSRYQAGLIGSEIVIAVVLLVGAGLMTRSLWALREAPLGFRPDNVLTMRLDLSATRYPLERRAGMAGEIVAKARRLGTIRYAGAAFPLPLSGDDLAVGYQIEGQNLSGQNLPNADLAVVTEGYFETLEIPVVRGRAFTTRDQANSRPVAIIDEVLARQWFSGGNPIGRWIQPKFSAAGPPPRREIVGVSASIRSRSLRGAFRPTIFVPHSQLPLETLCLVARGTGDSRAATAGLRNEIKSVDPAIPVHDIVMFRDYFDRWVVQPRFNTMLLVLFAGTALILATIGLYGAIAYSIARRTRDFGVRLALGATRGNIIGLVLRQALLLAGVSLGVGLLGAFALTRSIARLLYGVPPSDPLTFAAVSVLVVAVTLVASYLPARRISAIDPALSIRAT